MSQQREKVVDDLLGKMTLEQKVGGTLVMDFTGTILSPYAIRMIRDFHVAGLRVDTCTRAKRSYVEDVEDTKRKKILRRSGRAPAGFCKDFDCPGLAPYSQPADYVRTVNKLRDIALERPLGIPIHTTLDQENNGSENFTLGNVRLFPCAMGLAATNDPDLVYRVAKAQARQIRAAGFNWIHSPVLGVNTNHNNPEIGPRAYSDDPDVVTKFALRTLKAFQEEKLIATGKHFPGRGASDMDAHFGLPTIDISKEELLAAHVKPYVELMKQGLPSIMAAHTIYPCIDPEHFATVSQKVLTEFLRGELGFEGVLTTDNMLMGGLVGKYGVAEGCIRTVVAGADLVLLRSESPLCEEVYNAMLAAARDGTISEQRLDEANRRVLSVKYDYGLFENGGKMDPEKAADPQNDPVAIAVETEAAQKATLVRNRDGVLPVSKDKTILLIDQVHVTQQEINNYHCHPCIFWELMLEEGQNVYNVEFMELDEKAKVRIERRIPEADVLVFSNWIGRRSRTGMADYIRSLLKFEKPIIVVTNSPFEWGAPEDFPTVINIFSANPASLKVASQIIFGSAQAQGTLPIRAQV